MRERISLAGLEWVVERHIRCERAEPESLRGADRICDLLRQFVYGLSDWEVINGHGEYLEGRQLEEKRDGAVTRFRSEVQDLIDAGVITNDDVITVLLETHLETKRLSQENAELVRSLPSMD